MSRLFFGTCIFLFTKFVLTTEFHTNRQCPKLSFNFLFAHVIWKRFNLYNNFSTRAYSKKRKWRSKKISDISMFMIVIDGLKKFRQGHDVQFSQWHHLIVNVKIYKCLSHISCASSYSFRNVTILNYWRLERWSRPLRTIFWKYIF